MYALRCTLPLLKRLKTDPRAKISAESAPTTTLLGDWYANRLNLGRDRLVLCTNERCLLCVVVPAKDLPALPDRLQQSLTQVLLRLDLPASEVRAEIDKMSAVRFDRTASRGVLGSMTDFQKSIKWNLDYPNFSMDPDDLSRFLNKTLCSPLKYDRPEERVRQIFAEAR